MTNVMNENMLMWFDALTAEQTVLAKELRDLIFAANSDFCEDIKWKMPNYSLNKLVCYLQKSKAHLTIGFQQGAHLNDPEGWLSGTGKDMRHMKIALGDDVDVAKIKFIIQQAIQYDEQKA